MPGSAGKRTWGFGVGVVVPLASARHPEQARADAMTHRAHSRGECPPDMHQRNRSEKGRAWKTCAPSLVAQFMACPECPVVGGSPVGGERNCGGRYPAQRARLTTGERMSADRVTVRTGQGRHDGRRRDSPGTRSSSAALSLVTRPSGQQRIGCDVGHPYRAMACSNGTPSVHGTPWATRIASGRRSRCPPPGGDR